MTYISCANRDQWERKDEIIVVEKNRGHDGACFPTRDEFVVLALHS